MPSQRETEIGFERRRSLLIVRIRGSIELFCVESLRKSIADALEAEETTALVVSFAEVTLVDSTGLGLFIALEKRLHGSCELRLCEMSASVKAVFQYARIFSRFDVDDSLASTLASLGAKP